MKLVQAIMENCPCYKEHEAISPEGLMLHSVGTPQPSAEVWIRIFGAANYNRASVHGFIDANTGIAYQTLPWDIDGWHAGGSANDTYIGIEMCESAYIRYTSGNKFTVTNKEKAQADCKRAYNTAVELFAYLCKKFNLNPLTCIHSHKEGYSRGIASNHGDPEHYWNGLGMGYTMDGFRKEVLKAMGGNVGNLVNSPSKPSASKVPDIAVDGSWGTATTKLAQKIFGTTVDGVVSNQPYSNKKVLANASTISWEFKTKNYNGGSSLIRAIQKKIGVTVDGWFGPNSVKAFQRWLGVTVDGSMGPKTVKAFQKWLNNNRT